LGTGYFTRLTAAEDLPEIVTAMFDRLLPMAKSSRAVAEPRLAVVEHAEHIRESS